MKNIMMGRQFVPRKNGIHARHKRRHKVTTDSKHGLPVTDKLLDRNSPPVTPKCVWTSDITYLWTDEGWLYPAIVLDLFNREVHGVRYAPHADMKAASFKYIEAFYNRKWQHSTLDYQSPIQYLDHWRSVQHQEKRAA